MIDKSKIYRTRSGREVRIYATDGEGQYPVHGAVKDDNGVWEPQAWSKDGVFNCFNLADDPLGHLVEYNPLSDLKVDDRIFVRNNDNAEWCCQHFAGINKYGKVIAFDNGKTSWTSDSDDLVVWNQWKLPE